MCWCCGCHTSVTRRDDPIYLLSEGKRVIHILGTAAHVDEASLMPSAEECRDGMIIYPAERPQHCRRFYSPLSAMRRAATIPVTARP